MTNFIFILYFLVSSTNFFFQIVFCEQIIPTEDSFQTVKPYLPKYFSIAGGESPTKSLLKYENHWEEGDCIIQFAKGMSYTSLILIYKGYNLIAKDEFGNYINYSYSFALDKKEIILNGKEMTYKGVIYIIILDSKHYYLEDYLTVFNEMDAIPLSKNKISIVNKFYTKRERFFTILCNKEQINVSMKAFNKTKRKWIIKKEGEDIPEKEFESNDFDIKLNIDKQFQGSYTGIIKMRPEENYNDIIQLFYNTNDRIIYELKQDIILELPLIKTSEFSFFLPIDNMPKYGESSITVFLEYPLNDKNILKAFNGRVINALNSNDDTLSYDIPKIPTLTQFTGKQYKDYDTYFELFFFNSENPVKNQKPYLLLYLQFEFPSNFVPNTPLRFSLVSPEKTEVLDFIFDRKTDKFELDNFIPFFYKINFPPCLTKSYLIYVSNPNIHTIYFEGLFNQDHSKINDKTISNQLVGLSKSDKYCPKYVIIQLLGPAMPIYITIEASKGDLFYSQTPHIQLLTYQQITDCQDPFYQISSYFSSSQFTFYIEVISGVFEFYYKNTIVEIESIELFPNKKDLLENNYGIMKTSMDLLGLKCSIPGAIKINIIPQDKAHLSIGEQVLLLISPNKKSVIEIQGAIGEFGLEISTPMNVEIQFTIDTKTYFLSKLEPLWKKLMVKETKILTFASSNSSIVIIKTGNNVSLMEKLSSEEKMLNKDKHIYYKIKPNTDYYEIEFVVENLSESGFKYELNRGALPYITLPSLTNNQIIKPDNKNQAVIKFMNPYELQPLNENYDKGIDYYLAISFEDNAEKIDNYIHLSYKAKTPVQLVEENTLLLLSTNQQVGIKKNIDKVKQLLVVANRCSSKISILSLKYYSQNLGQIALTKQINYFQSLNYNLDMHLEISGEENLAEFDKIAYSYKFIDTDFNYDLFDDLKLVFNYNNITKQLSWNINKDLSPKYHVYAESKNITDMNNDCYLQSLTPFQSTLNNTVLFSKIQKGDYYISIAAEILNPIKMRISLATMKISINENQPEVPPTSFDYMMIVYIVIGVICFVGILWGIYLFIKYKRKQSEIIVVDPEIQPLSAEI